MVDFVKKVVKYQGSTLHPGEEVVAAIFTQAAGGVARQVAGGAIGGIIGAVAAEKVANKRAAEHEGADAGGLAASFPRKPTVLALTPQRLLVFGHGQLSGRPQDLELEFRLDQVHEIALEKRKVSWQLLITFSDNSVLDLDVPRVGGKPEAFKAALDRLKGRA